MDLSLTEAVLLDRRQRFLADVELADGTRTVAHLANTGRMTNCWAPGARCRLSHSDNPARKLAWELYEAGVDAPLVIVEQPHGHVEAERADLVDELARLLRR